MSSAWKMYDTLIESIPPEPVIEECIIGLNWTYVRAGDYAGIAVTFRASSGSGLTDGPYIGKSLREVAAGVKSWDMLRASVGMAAVNAWFNSPEKIAALGLAQTAGEAGAGAGGSIFDEPLENLLGKKVAVIGHFPYIKNSSAGNVRFRSWSASRRATTIWTPPASICCRSRTLFLSPV